MGSGRLNRLERQVKRLLSLMEPWADVAEPPPTVAGGVREAGHLRRPAHRALISHRNVVKDAVLEFGGVASRGHR